MSCGNHHDLPCTEVVQVLFLFIDNEIEDQSEKQAIEIHIQECPPCRVELEYESQVLSKLKNLLSQECQEPAPDELNERIRQQTAEMAAAMTGGAFIENWQISHTQITTTIVDENGIETTIEIESTTEYRGEF